MRNHNDGRLETAAADFEEVYRVDCNGEVAVEFWDGGVIQMSVGIEWMNRQLRRDDISMDQTPLSEAQLRQARELLLGRICYMIDDNIARMASSALAEVRR